MNDQPESVEVKLRQPTIIFGPVNLRDRSGIEPGTLLDVALEAARQLGPGTTCGGRAEAGWFEVGTIVGDGPTFTPDADQ